MFSEMMKVSDEILSNAYGITIIYKGEILLKGTLSTPNVIIKQDDYHLASVLQKKILEIFAVDYSGEIKTGEKVTIDGVDYIIVEILPDEFGNRKLILEEYENGN